jgi:hypothetical protein
MTTTEETLKLYAAPEMTCAWVPRPNEPGEPGVPCGALSRYVVTPAGGGPAFPPDESCMEHLAETVPWLLRLHGGVRAVVSVRWDREECGCGPDERCFDGATDDELAAAVPPWPSMGAPDGH